ncbi:MAG: phage tail tube protein [Solirubrobacteraceae bacterium]
MSWNKASELVVPGNGEVYFAAIGTTLPAQNTDPTAALNAAFTGLGYITEDGIAFTVTPAITEFRAMQSLQAVRRERSNMDFAMTCALEQWNEETVVAALGGAMTDNGTYYTWTPPEAGDALDEWSVVVDIQDGTRNMRVVYPRANLATETAQVSFKRNELATLPIGIKTLPPNDGSASMFILFDDGSAFAAGS